MRLVACLKVIIFSCKSEFRMETSWESVLKSDPTDWLPEPYKPLVRKNGLTLAKNWQKRKTT